MIVYQVMIEQERRSARLATVVANGELLSLGSRIDNIDDANILYAASWDQVSPYIVLLKGDNDALLNRLAGWPTLTQAEYEAQQQAAQPSAQSEFDQLEQQAATWPDFSVRW